METKAMDMRVAALGLAVLTLAASGRCRTVSAQPPAGEGFVTSLGVGVSGDHLATRDRLVSPRPHRGSSLGQKGFFLSVAGAKSCHEVELRTGSLAVASGDPFRFERGGRGVITPESETELVEASYTFLRRITERSWVGVSVAGDASHTKYELGVSGAESFLYQLSLQLTGRRDVDLGPRRWLGIQLRLPLLAWVARPTFSTVDEARLQAGSDVLHRLGNGKLATPLELRGLSGRIAFHQVLGSHVGFRAAMRLGYVRHDDPERFEAVRAGLELSLLIRWPGGDR
jgi:hypothetical protein